MLKNKRVYITGASALTACGATLEQTWSSIVLGQTVLAEINTWQVGQWDRSCGGELKNFQPAHALPDRRLMKFISRQDVMGINVVAQALEHSKLLQYQASLNDPIVFNEQTGVYVGSPGNKYFQQYDFLPLLAQSQGNMHLFGKELLNEVHPMWLLRTLPNNVLAYTGITYGFKGANHNFTNHVAGGMQAIIEAYHAIQSGQIERAVVVAYDMGIEPLALLYYEQLGVVSATDLK